MYKIHVVWNLDGNTITRDIYDVEKAFYNTSSANTEVPSNNMLSHQFLPGVNYWFQGPTCNYLINHKGIISLEVYTQS
jgi:hypothetical protein